MDKIESICPFCSSQKISYLRKVISPINSKEYFHFRCLNCDLEFFNPLKFESNIYKKELLNAYKEFHKGRHFDPDWINYLKKFLKKQNYNLANNKKVLDIGAGDCINFETLIKLGLDPKNYWAIELDNLSIKVCKKRGVSNLINKFFDKNLAKIIPQKFDLILLTQVLEHQIKPKDFLDACFNLLKSDGFLFITVPNRDRFFLKYTENPYDLPPHHFLRFNKKFFLKNFSNKIIFCIDYTYSIKSLSKSVEVIKNYYPLFKKTLFFPYVIALILRILGKIKGENLLIILKK